MNLNAVLHHIPPLDMDHPAPTAPAVEEYFRHYRLDFGATMAEVSHYIGRFESGQFDLVCQLFLRPDARGTIFVVHGYFDHVGLYAPLIGHLLSRNFSVVAFDLPGHGLSSGESASISSFSSYDRALEDCIRLCQANVAKPLHVVGQSTGAAAVMSYLMREQHQPFDKIILLAPLVRPRGWHLVRMAHFVLKPFRDQLRRDFKTNSHDPAFVDFVEHQDPLQSRYLILAWIGALKHWIKWFLQQLPSPLPLLVIQGEEDETVDWRYNIKVIGEKFPAAQFSYAAQGNHHLVGESVEIRAMVFQAIDRYLENALPADTGDFPGGKPDRLAVEPAVAVVTGQRFYPDS